jgi:hypothetical protein
MSESCQSIFEPIFSRLSTDYSGVLRQLLSKRNERPFFDALGEAVSTDATEDIRLLQPCNDSDGINRCGFDSYICQPGRCRERHSASEGRLLERFWIYAGKCGDREIHLQENDRIALTVAGMSACLGAVVRAPITSILIVFEMTHQFSFVPLLMIGTIASQAVSRGLCHTNFYSDIIERDGIELERHMPPRSLASMQSRPVSTIANFSPIFANSADRAELERLCTLYPYQQFPLVIDGQLVGLIDRGKLPGSQSLTIAAEPAKTISAHATIREAVATIVESSLSLLVVLSKAENTPIGIITLHDVLRSQNQLSDAAFV